LEILFPFFTKTSYLNEEVKCTEPSPHLVFPEHKYSFTVAAKVKKKLFFSFEKLFGKKEKLRNLFK
jgi:hypothetical protein